MGSYPKSRHSVLEESIERDNSRMSNVYGLDHINKKMDYILEDFQSLKTEIISIKK